MSLLRKTRRSQSTLLQPRSNPGQLDDSEELILDNDTHVGYRRPKVITDTVDFNDDNEELSDYVKFRLFLARQLALKKYQEVRNQI